MVQVNAAEINGDDAALQPGRVPIYRASRTDKIMAENIDGAFGNEGVSVRGEGDLKKGAARALEVGG